MTYNLMVLLAALVFGGLGLFIIIDYARFNRIAIKTKGKVVRYDEYQSKGSNGHKKTMYRPYFEFIHLGKVFEVKSTTSFSHKVIPVGSAADVLFVPGQEDKARLAEGHSYTLGVLFLFLSLPAFYLGFKG